MLLNKESRIIVRGIQSEVSLYHVRKMIEFGMSVVAGILPGEGGEWILDGRVPLFDSVEAAVDTTGADAAILFDDDIESSEGLAEAVFCEIPLIICSIRDIPIQDMLRIKRAVRERGLLLIGPGSPGIYSPEGIIAGIAPEKIGIKGEIGIVSSSAALGFEIISYLRLNKIGVSTFICIGEGPLCGSDFGQIISLFDADAESQKILLIDTPFGPIENLDIDQIIQFATKTVVAYYPGSKLIENGIKNLPEFIKQKRAENFLSVKKSLVDAGIPLVTNPEKLPALLS